MTGIQYDQTRKTNTINSVTGIDTLDPNNFLRQLNPSPYDISYDVHIATKNMDDGLQIIEQILPYFQPSYTLNIQDIPELAITKDVPVLFQGIGFRDEYEGGFDGERVMIWTLSFVVKGYLYPPIGNAAIIKKVIATFYKDQDLVTPSGAVTVKVDPINSAYNAVDSNGNQAWTILTDIYGEEQLDSNGNPPP